MEHLLSLLLCVAVFQASLHQTHASAVGTDCSGGAAACVASDNVECIGSDICECKSTFMNTGTEGACLTNACSSNAAVCNSIANSYCDSGTCVCDSIHVASTAVDKTKGSCIAKSCASPNTDACDEIDNAECSTSDECACTETYKLDATAGKCVANELTDSCTADAECADVPAVCRGADGAKTCKTAVDLGAKCDHATTKACADANAEATCDGTNGTPCKCKRDFYNKGDGTCVAVECSTEASCTAQNAYMTCTLSKCVCKATAKQSTATDTTFESCIPIKIDGACTENGGECADIAGAECTSSTCSCASTHNKLSTSQCLKKPLGEDCTAAGDCSAITGTTCDQTCKCDTNHNTVGDVCLKKPLGIGCTADGSECVAMTGAICSPTSKKTCVCSSTYELKDDACVKKATENGSAMLGVSTGLMLLAVLTAMM